MKKPATLLLAAAFLLPASSAWARRQEKQSEATQRAAEPPAEGEQGEMEGWKWANFALLAAGLGFLVVKNAGPFFAARSKKIHLDMKESEGLRMEAEQRAAAVDRRLARLDSEIAELRSQSKAEAESEAKRIALHTQQEIVKIRVHAQSEIEAAGKAARSELKRYSAHLAVSLAEQKVASRIDSGTEDHLVRGFLEDLAKPDSRAQSN